MPEEKQSKKMNAKMKNIWASTKNIKRLRKLRLIEREPDDSVLTRILDRIEKVGIDEQSRPKN